MTTAPSSRAAAADAALALYDEYLAFALPRLTAAGKARDAAREKRFYTSMATAGRERLRRLPRDGDLHPGVMASVEFWMSVPRQVMDSHAADGDLEALSAWISMWPDEVLRTAFYTGLRNPDGADEAIWQLAAMLPEGWRISVDMGAADTVITAVPPSGDPLVLRRYAGTGSLYAAWHTAFRSLLAYLPDRLAADAERDRRRIEQGFAETS
jgi:hypothetical protein